MYYLLYNHLSLSTCAKHGFKSTYNVVDRIGLFTFFEGRLYLQKLQKTTFYCFMESEGKKYSISWSL